MRTERSAAPRHRRVGHRRDSRSGSLAQSDLRTPSSGHPHFFGPSSRTSVINDTTFVSLGKSSGSARMNGDPVSHEGAVALPFVLIRRSPCPGASILAVPGDDALGELLTAGVRFGIEALF